jgi:hypothetical protein
VSTHCCLDLANTTQTLRPDGLPDGDRTIAYDPVFAEYRLVEHRGRLHNKPLRHCPWCGADLPPSRRLKWFAAINHLGFTPDDPDLPTQFATDQWWDGNDQ